MNVRLEQIPPGLYAERVLPHTHSLWGGSLPLQTYLERNLATASGSFGRKYFRTYALRDGGGEVLASFKRYERTGRVNSRAVRGAGIGAVFTPEQHRGRGHATAMLAMALDDARAQGFDVSYLFSDIHPQFYKTLGFHELPSRTITVRADALPAQRIASRPIGKEDWSGIRTCFAAMESARPFAMTRTALAWSWVAARMEQPPAPDSVNQTVNLAARRGKTIAAYVFGERDPKHDAYVVEEVGFSGEGGAALAKSLLRAAAGDLRRITGWLPPLPARALLARGSVRRRTQAIAMLAPLTKIGQTFLDAACASGAGDPFWAADHV